MIIDKRIFGAIFIMSGVITGSFALAAEPNGSGDVQFPIAELGGCQSQAECKVYCDASENVDACLSFAAAHQMMSGEELATAKKFQEVGLTGPGGCQGKVACQEYCDNRDNVEACVAFGEKSGLMSEEKVQESKKVIATVKNNAAPLRCDGQQDCDRYCATTEGMEECINFGVAAGILPGQEQDNARKVLTAIKNGAVPPCRGEECEATCNTQRGLAACREFAEKAGIFSRGKMIMLQRILTAIKNGNIPSSCDDASECQDYCSQDVHLEECVKFAETAAGLTAEEAAAARGVEPERPVGPGGCTSKEECDAFCGQPDNSETCFAFAKANGKISEDELKKIEDGQQKLKNSLSNMPEAIASCLNASLGADTIAKLKDGGAMPSPSIGEKLKACFALSKPSDKPEQESGQATSGEGKCGDGKCGSSERADPTLCPQDCGQSGQATPSSQPNQPNQSGQPTQPSQPGQPTQPNQPPPPRPTSPSGDISQPTPPSTPTSPTSGTGSCGDGKCGSVERADPTLCPQDCGGDGSTTTPPAPPTQPTQPPPPPPTSTTGDAGQLTPPAPPTSGTGRCGDGICGRMEQADPTLCPQDCGGDSQPKPPPPPAPPIQP